MSGYPLPQMAAVLIAMLTMAWPATAVAQTATASNATAAAQTATAASQPSPSADSEPASPPPPASTRQTPIMSMPPTREGSGTSWLPDTSPMDAIHHMAGPWTLMLHGNGFVQYLRDGGDRGESQAGSINWMMLMAERRAAGGRFGLRAMVSLEPWTIRGCGYPDLLASGEACDGEAIHDRQHPHDLFMELAASYQRAISPSVKWQIYGGPAAEPALGPVAFPHRMSALPNPLAPISHHWFDATHVSFGVVTTGLSGARWKAEASAFNGREPDEERRDINLGALDSYSGRVWWLPNDDWSIQVSAGRLTEAEQAHEGDGRLDVTRVTASATYHRVLERGLWASTLAWGRNHESGGQGSHALLLETSLSAHRNVLFGRVEWAQKSGHDLDLTLDDEFAVVKLQEGYTRYLPPAHGLQPGVGVVGSIGIVPEALRSAYGARTNPGIGVYFTLRTTSSSM